MATSATVGGKITAALFNELVNDVAASGGVSRVVPSSTPGTGNAFNATTGLVTATASSGVQIRGVFSSTYTNYRMVYRLTTSASAGFNMTLTTGATEAVTAYDNQRFTSVSTASSSVLALNTTAMQPDVISNIGIHSGVIEFFSPAEAVATTAISDYFSMTNPGTTAAGGGKSFMQHRTTTAYDGIKFTPYSGTVTGTVQIYGYTL